MGEVFQELFPWVVITLGLFSSCVLLWCQYFPPKLRDADLLQRMLDGYQSRYLTKSGSWAGHGHYNIFSIDGGQTWYNTEPSFQDGLRIISEANPELIRQLAGFDRLVAHAREHGPVDPGTEEGRRLLTEAGFQVIRS